MKFITDKQTINDLDLFEKVKGEKSVIELFNHTKSIGGRRMLERIFHSPLNNAALIEHRMNTIKYFCSNPDFIEINKEWLDFIEFYLLQRDRPAKFSPVKIIYRSFITRIKPNNDSYVARRGINYLTILLNELFYFFKHLPELNNTGQLMVYRDFVIQSISGSALKETLKYKTSRRIRAFKSGHLDFIYRNTEINKIRLILDLIYEVDALKAVSISMTKSKLVFPVIQYSEGYISIKGLFHPFITDPVPNDIELSKDRNLCFITGPNMAGKSTYLKAFGISVYLAHLGFPVPAKSMQFSVFNGLFTTINLPDNISNGYSHFYNEVLRIKNIAEQIKELKNMIVVFDELFRGTNVKDAYEASLSVITAFSKIKTSLFTISTHIIEIADQLMNNGTIDFKYFAIKINNNIPEYTYKLKQGVTNERIGMYILDKEKVIETIEKAI